MSTTSDKLDAKKIRARTGDNAYTLYLNYAFFIKGAVIAATGVALYLIVTTDGASEKIDRAMLWLASFGFSCAMISAWSRVAIFSNSEVNGWDFILPILTGVWDVLMYIVLTPLPHEPPARWLDWYLVFGFFAISAGLTASNRRMHAREYATDADTDRLVAEYRIWLRSEAAWMFGLGVLSLVLYALSRLWPGFESVWLTGWQRTASGALIFVAGIRLYFSSR